MPSKEDLIITPVCYFVQIKRFLMYLISHTLHERVKIVE